jgi:hypothetical protein
MEDRRGWLTWILHGVVTGTAGTLGEEGAYNTCADH